MRKYINDEGLAQIWTAIQAALNSKVSKELGKGLSTNDFSNAHKNKLDDIDIPGVRIDTTAHWSADLTFIPQYGEILIYTDRTTVISDGKVVNVPGIKIGDGRAYGIDLPFADSNIGQDVLERLEAHLNNDSVHVTPALKAKWNNKINVDDNQEVVEETLIINRN